MFLLQSEIQKSYFPSIVITAAFIIVALALIFLIFFITARHQQNKLVLKQQMMQEEFSKQLMLAQIEVQEYTSAALSQELHDNIGQLLGTVKLMLAITAKELKVIPDTLDTAAKTLSKAIQDLRSLSKSLDKEWLQSFNFVENLHTETDRINASRDLKVQFNSEFVTLPLSSEAQVMLFRVVQEAIQNSIKHANPQNIAIHVKGSNHQIQLRIEDDGSGFDASAPLTNGLGMRNMAHRIKLLNGNIKWRKNGEKGTQVAITLNN